MLLCREAKPKTKFMTHRKDIISVSSEKTKTGFKNGYGMKRGE